MEQGERKLGRSEGLPAGDDTGEANQSKTFVLPADDPPRSGEWVDTDEVIANPTDEEVAAGVALGQTINTEDDEDNGLTATDPPAGDTGTVTEEGTA